MSEGTDVDVPADEDLPEAEVDTEIDTGGVSDGVADDVAEAGNPEEEDFEDDFDEVSAPERVLDVCLRHIVDNPDAIEIDVEEDRRRLTLHVRVAQEDMGKVIGRNGRVANALRTLIKAAGSRDGIAATVEIDD